ncbi:MAG: hypothetical protein J6I76_11630 [Oribacterium sp.]|nr:hypothetical protein [Oribacterium sp.]
MEKLNGINLIGILVEKTRDHDFSGVIINQYDDRRIEFDSCMSMLNELDTIYDDWGFPEASSKTRSFTMHRSELTNEGGVVEKKKLTHIAAETKPRDISQERGKAATFLLLTEMRQHSSWQGVVLHVEGDKKSRFDSVLDLLFLMDEALG